MKKVIHFLKNRFFSNLVTKLLLVVIIFIIIGTFIIYFSEKNIANSKYNDIQEAFFGTIVFICSGFDADSPLSPVGKATSIFLILFGIAIVSYLTAIVASIIVDFKLKEDLGMKKLSLKNHILICGYTNKAKDIINELLSDDIKEKRDIVIIDPVLEHNPMSDNYLVHFIKGDPSKKDVLLKADIMNAHTAIILSETNEENRNRPSADAVTILTALAIETLNPDIYTCVEILDPDNIHHLKNANVDEIICTNDISSKILVQSAINHGLSKMLSEMLSYDEGNEIYKIPVPKSLVNRDFKEALVELSKNSIILMSVEKDGEKIITNPENECILDENDKIFVIAKDKPMF